MSARWAYTDATPMLIARTHWHRMIVLAMLDGKATVSIAQMSMSAIRHNHCTIVMPMHIVATPLVHSNVHVMTVIMVMA